MPFQLLRRSCGVVFVILTCLLGLVQSCNPRAVTGTPTAGSANQHPGGIPRGFGDGWSEDADWLPVLMRPQPTIEFQVKGLSLSGPRELLPLLPLLPEKAPSYLPEDLIRDGAAFDPALPNSKVTASGIRGEYAPDWPLGASQPLADAAYAIYRFPLTDYDQQSTLALTWATPPEDWNTLYVGFANISRGRWDWYKGPADGVLTVGGFDDYYYPNGDVLVAVVELGTQQVLLTQLRIGASETRYVGMETGAETPPDDLPTLQPLDPGEICPLPPSVDLRPLCAPVGDQQNLGACTAFALAQGVYSAMLSQLYGGYGWDANNPWYQAGPKYLYYESGIAQGLGEGDGRKFPDTIQNMMDLGTASETHAPFDFSYDLDWSSEAIADAALFQPDGYTWLNTDALGGIDTMKAILALTQRPLLVAVGADWDWAIYQAGTVLDKTPGYENHAVCIVGYDDTKGMNGAFLVRNSWSEYWGEGGYCWVTYRTFIGSKQVYVLQEDFDPAVVERFTGKTIDSIPGAPSIPPPSSMQASDGEFDDHVALDWSAVPTATGYRIYRDDKAALLQELGAETQWDDASLTTLCPHIYWVTALKGAEESLPVTFDTGYLARPPVPVPPGDWSNFGRDLKHTRRSPNTGPSNPEAKWTSWGSADSPQLGNLEPIIDVYGRLYVSHGQGIRCFGPPAPGDTEGYIYWDYDAPNAARASYGGTIGNDAIYMGDDDGLLSAVNFAGKQLWTFDAGSSICAPPIVGPDGTIYCGTLDGLLFAVNPDGTEKWRYAAGGGIFGSPAMDDTGALYFGCRAAKLVKGADAGDHFALAWEYACGGDVDCSPTIGEDCVYFITLVYPYSDRLVYKLDLDGNVAPGWPFTGDLTVAPCHWTSGALAQDGTYYVAAGEVLLALNPDGSTKWTYDCPDADFEIEASPTVGGDGTVYCIANRGQQAHDARLYALNPADGAVKWCFEPDELDQSDAHTMGPSIDGNGMLYITSCWGPLYAIGEAN